LFKNSIITDKEIFLKIARNDLEAFKLLYDRYSPLLYTIIKKIVKDEETSEKVLAETFLIVWRWAEEFDFVVYNVYTFMILLARNKAIDTLRRKRGEKGMPEYNDEYEILKILPQLSPENESLEREYLLNKNTEILKIIDSLSEEQRKLFWLAYSEGLDEKYIADKTGFPPKAIKPQMQKIMGILMQKLIG